MKSLICVYILSKLYFDFGLYFLEIKVFAFVFVLLLIGLLTMVGLCELIQ